jgi:predicted AlkP superfamily phosphohydrolase/phosphomutase/Tfp pilus assembly protein PilF
VLLTLVVFAQLQCARAPRTPILLVGIDGADWNLLLPMIREGKLPNLARLLQEGVGAPLESVEPLISPLIWTTIATGKGPDRHGVLDFTMPDPKTGQPIPVSGYQRRTKAFWDILSQAGKGVGVVAWWATWPAEEVRGCMVSDRVTSHAFIRAPQATSQVTYPEDFYARVVPRLMDWKAVSYATTRRFLNISREEFDAHTTFDFKDPITHFRHIYAAMHNVTELALAAWDDFHPDVLAVYYEGVDSACHLFLRYAPPPYPYATPEDRERFGHTVEAVYAYQDSLLGRLLEAVGPEARVLVVSDHGFLTGRSRPLDAAPTFDYATAARWHRRQGVLLLSGPGIRKGETLAKATVFDVTPTLLHLAGLPVAEDMEGRALTEALEADQPDVRTIPTYEDPEWTARRERQLREMTSPQDPELVEKLRSLGYVGGGGTGKALSVRGRLSLAEYYIWRGDTLSAERELEGLLEVSPGFPDALYDLGLLRLRAQRWKEAEALFRQVLEKEPKNLDARQNLAAALRRQDRRAEAAQLLEETREMYPLVGAVARNLAILYREMGQPEKALTVLEEALEQLPGTHPLLAQRALALEALGRLEEAREAWRQTLEARPDDRIAQDHLQRLEERLPAGGQR